MAVTPEGFAVFAAEVTAQKGPCSAGHQVGDRLSLSCWDPGGLCGYFYHDIFPALSLMQFGGQYPWAEDKDRLEVRCPDPGVRLTLVIRKDS